MGMGGRERKKIYLQHNFAGDDLPGSIGILRIVVENVKAHNGYSADTAQLSPISPRKYGMNNIYNAPVAKTNAMPSFLVHFICILQTIGIGSTSSIKSVKILNHP